MGDIGPGEILIVLLIVAVLFGAKKLPELARSVGRAQGEFKKGLKEGADAFSLADEPEGSAAAPAPIGESPAIAPPAVTPPAAPPDEPAAQA